MARSLVVVESPAKAKAAPSGWGAGRPADRACPFPRKITRGTMPIPLLIVESPAKARTLSGFLGNRYRVMASVGHVRDLPNNASEVPEAIKGKEWGAMAVDVENDFQPYYVVSSDRRGTIRDMKAALKDASEVLLATDPDREGESISWHLLELLKPKVPVRRIVFHEITEEAVRDAIDTFPGARSQPGGCAGKPTDPGSSLRIQGVAGPLEMDCAETERGSRAERRRAVGRRAGGGAEGLPESRILEPRGDVERGRPGVHGDARSGGWEACRHREGFRCRHGEAWERRT